MKNQCIAIMKSQVTSPIFVQAPFWHLVPESRKSYYLFSNLYKLLCLNNYNLLFFTIKKSWKISASPSWKVRLLHPFLWELHSGISQMPEWSSLGISGAPIIWLRNKGFYLKKIHKKWPDLVVLKLYKNEYLYFQ